VLAVVVAQRGVFDAAGKRWRRLRAVAVALHVVAVLVLSMPSSLKLGDRRRWDRPRTQREFALWAKRLSTLGLPLTTAELDARLWRWAQGYLAVRERIAAPLHPYAYYCGVSQGWGMYKSPQREPHRLRVEVRDEDGWRVVHEGRSDAHDYRREQFDQHRMRKLVGRLISRPQVFDDMAGWIARQVARDFPRASHARVRGVRFRALPPARRRAGERPATRVAREAIIELQPLRGDERR
jgi:hypothetical protein